jgi:hypothetical protein
VAEHDRLACAPILVVNLGPIGCRDRWHVIDSFRKVIGSVVLRRPGCQKQDRRAGLTQLGGLEVLRGVLNSGVAEEARTRGFATPVFAGCACIVATNGPTVGFGTARVKMIDREELARFED